MTSEENIKWLEQIKDKYIRGGDEYYDESRKDAIDNAIVSVEKLEKAKQIIDHLHRYISNLENKIVRLEATDDDCISRYEAVASFVDIRDGVFRTNGSMIADYDIVKILKELPSIKTEQKQGHWKLVQRGKVIDVCCSNCGAVRIKEWAYNYTINELNKEDINECFGSADMRYCPNCGCRMESEE